MNHLFAQILKKDGKVSDHDFEDYLESQLPQLLETIFSVLRDNLESIFTTNEGLYCMLFIKNCLSNA